MAKILIVDDEEHIRFLYSEELTDEGYEVVTADSGFQLLERIEAERPDIIILDVKMIGPDGRPYDGLDLLQDIRNVHYGLPVILCTAYKESGYAIRGQVSSGVADDMRSIAADFLVQKSFDLWELKCKIKMALDILSPRK